MAACRARAGTRATGPSSRAGSAPHPSRAAARRSSRGARAGLRSTADAGGRHSEGGMSLRAPGTSRITLCVSARALLALLLFGALGLFIVGCGGDDEDDGTAETVPTTTAPAPVTTPPPEVPTDEGEKDPDEEPRTVPPEEQQGDEEPIRSEAVFTGTGGRLT